MTKHLQFQVRQRLVLKSKGLSEKINASQMAELFVPLAMMTLAHSISQERKVLMLRSIIGIWAMEIFLKKKILVLKNILLVNIGYCFVS